MAVHHAAMVHRIAAHVAIQTTVQHQMRASRAALLALADRLVATLNENLLKMLGITTDLRAVMLSAAQQRHILERRQLVSQFDADLAVSRIQEAFTDLQYQRIPQRRSDVYELIGYVPTVDRFLLIALKFVPAAQSKSHADEWWIRTAHPLGRAKFRQLKARRQLRPIDLA